MKSNQNILICPLGWGLGHAARMIPVARRLCEMNNNIFIAAGNEHLEFFRIEMPSAIRILFPGFKPSYSRFLPQYLVLLLQVPVLVWHIIREHSGLKKIIKEYHIDIVISDNRFGLWNKRVKTVYITHMPRIPFPAFFSFLEFIGVALHRSVIRKYDFCFIPDLPGELNLSGRLSHDVKLHPNTRFIGILSRFSIPVAEPDSDSLQRDHLTVILSGPEPQRSIMRKKLTEIFLKMKLHAVFLSGKPEGTGEVINRDTITYYNHKPAYEMKTLITRSKGIVSRPGYTTLMELVSLGCRALVVPTPGQTEQEYLARYLSGKGWFFSISQEKLTGEIDIPSTEPAWGKEIKEINDQSRILLENSLKLLLE